MNFKMRCRVSLSKYAFIVAGFNVASPANAQYVPSAPPKQVYLAPGNVDPIRGEFTYSTEDISVGSGDEGERISLVRTYRRQDGEDFTYSSMGNGFTHNYQIMMKFVMVEEESEYGTSRYAVGAQFIIGEELYSFNFSSTSGPTLIFTNENSDGAYVLQEPMSGGLTKTILVTSDGTRYHFSNAQPHTLGMDALGAYMAESPNGEFVSLTYEANGTEGYNLVNRLKSLQNSRGYGLNFYYRDPQTGGAASQEKQLISRIEAVRSSCMSSSVVECSSGALSTVHYAYAPLRNIAGGKKIYGLTSFLDAMGKEARYTYDGAERIKSESLKGNHSKFTFMNSYDSQGRIAYQDDAELNRTSYVYSVNQNSNPSMRQTSVTLPDSSVLRYGASLSSALPAWSEDALGNRSEYTYDFANRLVQVKDPQGGIIMKTLDDRGNTTAVRRKAKHGFSEADLVIYASFPACDSMNFRICNRPSYTVDARGARTDYQYEPTHGGLVTMLSPPDASGKRAVTRFDYQSYHPAPGVSVMGAGVMPIAWLVTGREKCLSSNVNDLVRDFGYVCPSGDRVRVAFNYTPSTAAARTSYELESSVTDPGGIALATSYTYDVVGNRLKENGPRPGASDTTSYLYDARRRVTQVTYPGSGVFVPKTQFAYDDDGRLTRSGYSYSGGSIASIANYDARGLVSEITGFDGVLYRYTYDAVGRLKETSTIVDGVSRLSTNLYDAAGRLLQIRRGVGSGAEQAYSSWSYSANGQLLSEQDANGNTTTACFDGFDRLVERRYPAPGGIGSVAPNCATVAAGGALPGGVTRERYTYDSNGNVTSRTDRGGQITAFTYDALGRNVLIDVPEIDRDTIYVYDLTGKLMAVNLPGTNATLSASWAYDKAGRVKASTSVGKTVYYNYDTNFTWKEIVWPGNPALTVRYNHDEMGRVTSIIENGGVTLAAYTYDELSRRTAVTYGNATKTIFGYDVQQRISSLTQDLAGSATDVTWNFTYNSLGQVKTLSNSNDAYAWTGHYDVNRLYTRNALNQYGSAGPATFSYDARGNLTGDGSWLFGYDSQNRLTSAGGVISATLFYDAMGRLARTSAGGQVSNFLYDGDDIIAEYDAADNVVRRTVFGPEGDEPLVVYEGNNRRWLYADRQGSIVAAADSAGNADAIMSYGPYGEPGSPRSGRFAYTGQVLIPEIGLYHFKARAYSPYMGRFLQSDPIGTSGGMNLYEYALSDPINFKDRSGLSPEEIVVIGQRPRGILDLIDWRELAFNSPEIRSISVLFRANSVMPQKGLWERTESALCSLPPIELTFGADAYLGVGASGALGGSLDLSTGQLRFVTSGALGVGGGGGVGGALGFGDRTSGPSFSSNVTGGYVVTGTVTKSTDSFANVAVPDSFGGASYGWGARAGLWGNQQIKYTSPPTPPLYKGC